ncbi:putative secreted protein [Wickerhamomyces ciferrii]|uniref:Secreted protein n=1 Tax=Wickerhamomyces ciferrii (strain ATCC 14091 / BCRC 22168 / CBS 111 / JCM 3599 / NBRC 0793 / NRRL Y-1031 F-60-10) TaxID=1206466 RepID=K0KUX2_WICCF|nr:uncharacterized protein BN7_6645 [Wickerhamomyces ciferrii]CCH47036.1 putative secreted protein [Wickerhamomyces ciferrii]
MKLFAIIVPSLLSLSVIGSTVNTEDSITTDHSISLPNNFTDPIIVEAGAYKPIFCNVANSKNSVCLGSFKQCVSYMLNGGLKDKNKDLAQRACKFYCSEIKNPTQCKQSKYKANYHPNWACDDQQYC